jgi:predicted flap endonuclease-1-like 5' DNA nuclease
VVAGAAQPLMLRVAADHPMPATSSLFAPRPAAVPALTEVLGIGDRRARKLKRAGIKSVRSLAGADPEYVAEAVGGVSLDSALRLIQHAKELLANHV